MPSVTFCWAPVLEEGLKYNLVDFKSNDVSVRGTYVFSLSAVVVKEHTAIWIAQNRCALSTRVRLA